MLPTSLLAESDVALVRCCSQTKMTSRCVRDVRLYYLRVALQHGGAVTQRARTRRRRPL
jgi:hypothetical protein